MKHTHTHTQRLSVLNSQRLRSLFPGPAPPPRLPGHASRPRLLLPPAAPAQAKGLGISRISPQDCDCDDLLPSLPASKSCSRTILLGHPFGPVTHSSASIFPKASHLPSLKPKFLGRASKAVLASQLLPPLLHPGSPSCSLALKPDTFAHAVLSSCRPTPTSRSLVSYPSLQESSWAATASLPDTPLSTATVVPCAITFTCLSSHPALRSFRQRQFCYSLHAWHVYEFNNHFWDE